MWYDTLGQRSLTGNDTLMHCPLVLSISKRRPFSKPIHDMKFDRLSEWMSEWVNEWVSKELWLCDSVEFIFHDSPYTAFFPSLSHSLHRVSLLQSNTTVRWICPGFPSGFPPFFWPPVRTSLPNVCGHQDWFHFLKIDSVPSIHFPLHQSRSLPGILRLLDARRQRPGSSRKASGSSDGWWDTWQTPANAFIPYLFFDHKQKQQK